MARGVSSPAGDDKGSSPLTSAAFLKNCCTKKLLILLLQKLISVQWDAVLLTPAKLADTPP
jgi:hypothetical protein